MFDLCVYGAPQPDGTQAPAAAIALRLGATIQLEQLTRELNQLLDAREQLVNVEILAWGEFPIGITGKTLKRVFRDRTEVMPQETPAGSTRRGGPTAWAPRFWPRRPDDVRVWRRLRRGAYLR